VSNTAINSEVLQDVFTRKGLGLVAWRVWEYLNKMLSPSGEAIGRELGINPGSVRRALKRLQEHGLITRGGDMFYCAIDQTEEQLERLSAVLGTLGKSAKRKRDHTKERGRRTNILVMQARSRWYSMLQKFLHNVGGNDEQ
jgi:DNA-binding transcriptional regulator YhcF (GntR family)